jgi:predicted lipase
MTTTIDTLYRMRNVQICMQESCRAYNECVTSSRCVRFTGAYDGQVTMTQSTNGQIVIAFRGTESWKDWMVNIMRVRSRFPSITGAAVHTGFRLQHDALWDKIITQLRTYTTLDKGILVTGHSLGGALATLFAVSVAGRMPNIRVSCFVFGSPRVGNRKFVEGIQNVRNLSVLRINNAYDIIPCIPWMGYTHTRDFITLPVKHARWYQIRKRHSMHNMYTGFMKKYADTTNPEKLGIVENSNRGSR